jgi:hypothetical protein
MGSGSRRWLVSLAPARVAGSQRGSDRRKPRGDDVRARAFSHAALASQQCADHQGRSAPAARVGAADTLHRSQPRTRHHCREGVQAQTSVGEPRRSLYVAGRRRYGLIIFPFFIRPVSNAFRPPHRSNPLSSAASVLLDQVVVGCAGVDLDAGSASAENLKLAACFIVLA